MSDILEKIVATKKIEVANNLKKISLASQREKAHANNQDSQKSRAALFALSNKRLLQVMQASLLRLKKQVQARVFCANTSFPLKLLNPMKNMAQLVYLY